MNVRRRIWSLACAGVLMLTVPVVAGCGPSTPDAKTANVQAGDMPEGGEWTGVYYSELYGYLHVVQDGNAISGKWIRPHKDKWGEVNGQVTGDLMKFEWKEHTVGLVGPNATRSGRGYFKYKRPQGDNVDDQIAGEIGRGADEVGDPWDAIKQRNVKPDLASIGGGGPGEIGGGDWDSENKEPGAPEAPQPPPAPE
ncbi:MAG: hypothetical protein R3B70_28570 [Polyangiaceae bacterium]